MFPTSSSGRYVELLPLARWICEIHGDLSEIRDQAARSPRLALRRAALAVYLRGKMLGSNSLTRATLATAWMLVAGCSGSQGGGAPDASGGGFTGLVTCDAGVNAGDRNCELAITLEGGISGTFGDFNACGASGPLLSWSNVVFNGAGPRLSIRISFGGTKPPIDQIGMFPLEYVDVVRTNEDAGSLTWHATGCSMDIEGSVCSPTSVFRYRRLLSGTVACPEPAQPQPGNTGAPVTIKSFTFLGFINPPPTP